MKRYYVGRVLGAGGYGITYMAWDKREERMVAIKELFPVYMTSRAEPRPPKGIADHPEQPISWEQPLLVQPGKEQEYAHVKKRFYEEANAQWELRDVPGIVRVEQVFEENNTVYYSMELLEGCDLKKYLAVSGSMSWDTLAPLVRKLLIALTAIHNHGMIHRDISPDNIFLTKNGDVKLIDFGNARYYANNTEFTAVVHQKFAPLEQFQTNSKQGPWTDIFSLCAVMYYALGARLPEAASTRLTNLKVSGTDGLVPISSLCPHLPRHVADTIQKGLALQPAERFSNLRDFSLHLFPGEAPTAPPSRQRAPEKRPQQTPAQPRNPAPKVYPQPARSAPPQPQNRGWVVTCVAGVLKGTVLPLQPGRVIKVGRGAGNQLVYPESVKSVSHDQCAFTMDNKGILYVRDEGSRFGTWLNGQRLTPFTWMPLQKGFRVQFSQETYLL